ncbi:protein phosphatase 1 regulatory subunit 21-like [Rhagoletis pomonella]|uniref:protein phosphatase 1 regulatory subunit 21-like n=1 Tax=Rhagoletis pomonella TaxID=28610 RepID=UPI001782DA0F|nr:protein phosphatase 1 regulatory subunit 21-like [Rhagoletis pomonella]
MFSGMEDRLELTATPEAKYQKLASEYSKLRARASVLRKAVLDEQSKGDGLREQLRHSETSLRRAEQEVDSLGFRNRQLEHRVAVLQDEIATHEGRNKRDKASKGEPLQSAEGRVTGAVGDLAQDALIFEELQKKIMENAELTTMIDDKERDLQIHTERIASLEQMLDKRVAEFTETEKRLRREMETLEKRNSELEAKLVDAVSMLGSEDALSVSGSDHTPLHVATPHHHHPSALSTANAHAVATADERISCLEKEMVHWRTQYEMAKLKQTVIMIDGNGIELKDNASTTVSAAAMDAAVAEYKNCSCSSTAAGLVVKPISVDDKSVRESIKEPIVPPTKELLIYNTFSQKFEDLLKAKYLAESRISSYEIEVEHFQICLENATHELKAKDEQMGSINQALQMLEEDLATTRVNYEEQISVLTEQVINLSEQLAACK